MEDQMGIHLQGGIWSLHFASGLSISYREEQDWRTLKFHGVCDGSSGTQEPGREHCIWQGGALSEEVTVAYFGRFGYMPFP